MSVATWKSCSGSLKGREGVQRSQLSPYKGHSDWPLQHTGLLPQVWFLETALPPTTRGGLLI